MPFPQMNLNANVAKGIVASGYTTPTPIQARAIPEILNGKDLVASAQTGTGKTAAFVLPALHLLSLGKATAAARILILTPTRELAAQITDAAAKYGRFMNFNIVSLVGGMPYRQQLRSLSRPVDIIVATPGRLLDLMENHKLDLSAIEMLVLDEADRMLDMGFIDDVRHIAKCTPKTRQTLLFSATVDKKLSVVIRDLLKNPTHIDLSDALMAPKLIKQEAYLADNAQHKERLLKHFLDNENIYKAIIFSGTKVNADYLTRRLQDMDYAAAALHGDLKQNVRNKTVEQLRRGKIQFLVATDVAARGIDINDVTHVFNYDLPKFSEDYVHRIGRTGRAGKTGIAISLVLPMDTRHLQKIEKYIGEKLVFATVPGLEPTKRMNNSQSNPDAGRKKKFGGKSSGGYSSRGSSERSGYAKRTDSRNGSEGRSSYARGGEGSGSEGRKSYGRSHESRNSEGRSSFARKPESRDNENRSSFTRKPESRDGEGRGSFARRPEGRDGEGRNSFARRSENRDSEGRGSFARRPESRDGEGRSSFAKRSEGRDGEGRSSFAKRSEGRNGEGRSSFARKPESRNNEGRSSFARKPEGRDGEGRSSFAKKPEGRGSFARKSEGRDGEKTFSRRGEGRHESRSNESRGENRSSFSERSSHRGAEGRGRSNDRGSFSKNKSGNDARITFSRDRDGESAKTSEFRNKPTTRPTTYAKSSFGKNGEGKVRRERRD